MLLTTFTANRNGDDFGSNTGLFQAHCLFDSNFAKWVDGHLDVIEINISTIGFGADFDVVINNALNGNKNLHGFSIDFQVV